MSGQYYYKTNKCKAKLHSDPDCVCWHDMGTGPLPNLDNQAPKRKKPALLIARQTAYLAALSDAAHGCTETLDDESDVLHKSLQDAVKLLDHNQLTRLIDMQRDLGEDWLINPTGAKLLAEYGKGTTG